MPDDDERIESLERVLRDNGALDGPRVHPYDTTDPEHWSARPRSARFKRAVWIALAVVVVLVVVIPAAVIIAARVS